MSLSPIRTATALALSALLLSACQSAEERAEDYYRSGLSYVEQGDIERAMIELRNVFNQDGFHKEARALYAELLLEQGRVGEAYGQLLRLVEQYPDTLEARRTLAELAAARNDWEEVRRHGGAAREIAPDDPGVRAVVAALAYRDALVERDDAAREAALDDARAIVEADPARLAARRVLIDEALRARDAEGALAQIDAALAVEPESLEFNRTKATLLSGMGDPEATGAQLKRMHALFPDNTEVGQALIAWYMTREDYDGAEAFLREQAGDADAEAPEGHLSVIQFLRQTQGDTAARAELDRLIAANAGAENADLYRALRASIDFENGNRQVAVAEIESVLENAEPSDQTRRIKVMQARMLAQMGNEVGARARIEEILAEDSSNVEALKMRAARLIQEDRPGAAIIDLRAALDQSPRDPGIVTLMAEAHLRDGSVELAQERLSLAVQLSENAAPESVRYARFLIQQDRPAMAETVLTSVARPDLETMALLGELFVRQQRWENAARVAAQLRASEDARAIEVADRIEGAALLGQNRVDEGLAFLRDGLDDPQSDLRDVAQLVRTQVAAGRVGEARETLDGLLEASPDDVGLRTMRAELYVIEGDLAAAESAYRAVLDRDPANGAAVQRLQAILRSTERGADADALIAQAYARAPQTRMIALLEAGRREQSGDAEGAIAVYEDIYAANSGDVLVANNLASLLTVHRDDPDDIERAYAIARRLNGSEVAAFRDTLGWIRYLRGDTDAAVVDLEAAAEGMPQDPSVAFHLGLAYAAAGRTEDARREIERGLDLAGDRDVPQRAEAEEALAGI